jgi:hypothetical protein
VIGRDGGKCCAGGCADSPNCSWTPLFVSSTAFVLLTASATVVLLLNAELAVADDDGDGDATIADEGGSIGSDGFTSEIPSSTARTLARRYRLPL